jgi:hypothetical protein
MFFQIIGKITCVETIAKGSGVRSQAKLKRKYGGKNWRKLKGIAKVRFLDGTERFAEIHWYEGHGIGQKEYKIKRFVD